MCIPSRTAVRRGHAPAASRHSILPGDSAVRQWRWKNTRGPHRSRHVPNARLPAIFTGTRSGPICTFRRSSQFAAGTQRRVAVDVLRTIEDRPGHFAGVLRIGLFGRKIHDLIRNPDPKDPHLIFLCDSPSPNDPAAREGRGTAPHATDADRSPGSRGEDLRYISTAAPPQILAALHLPQLVDLTPRQPPHQRRGHRERHESIWSPSAP